MISIKTFWLRNCNEQCSFCSFVKFTYWVKLKLRFRPANSGYGNVKNSTRSCILFNFFLIKLPSVFFRLILFSVSSFTMTNAAHGMWCVHLKVCSRPLIHVTGKVFWFSSIRRKKTLDNIPTENYLNNADRYKYNVYRVVVNPSIPCPLRPKRDGTKIANKTFKSEKKIWINKRKMFIKVYLKYTQVRLHRVFF